MSDRSGQEEVTFPLTFGLDTSRWHTLKPYFSSALQHLAGTDPQSYKEAHALVESRVAKYPLELPHPVIEDDDARAILDLAFECEEACIASHPTHDEAYRLMGRLLRQWLAVELLDRHMAYLEECFNGGEDTARTLAEQLGFADRFTTAKALQRFMKKINIYRQVESFIHTAELTLSSVKVKSRSGARAKRGNLWPNDRREKYAFLENLADSNLVCPPFTEEDLEFLVSQSSLDMLQKKTDLLKKELGYIEPNRLKANYSRLRDHLQRSKQRQSDFELRRDLLRQLGANDQQIDYISARATYQTMKNLLKLANGKLAISDLMGGKRTIRKLLRRKGQASSQAENSIVDYLENELGIDAKVAQAYARTRKNHSLEHLKQTISFLEENYARFYRSHWGFAIQPNIQKRALELGLSRQKLSKRSLSSKDFLNDLRRAVSLEEARMVKEQDTLPPDVRRNALNPLKEVLDYETDTDTRKQLYFIYEQFCSLGLCIPKDKLKEICLKNSQLFPSPRKVQDALEILNGAYRAVGQHGESLCVLPDYIDMPTRKTKPVLSS